MFNPRTLFVLAQTISFMKTWSGSPERVAFKGLKLPVKTSISPYSFVACNNPFKKSILFITNKVGKIIKKNKYHVFQPFALQLQMSTILHSRGLSITKIPLAAARGLISLVGWRGGMPVKQLNLWFIEPLCATLSQN